MTPAATPVIVQMIKLRTSLISPFPLLATLIVSLPACTDRDSEVMMVGVSLDREG